MIKSKSESPKPFKLNGKPFTLSGPTPSMDKLVKVLEAQPDGELLDSNEVTTKAGIGLCFIGDNVTCNPRLFPYRLLLPGKRRYAFGNPRTIVELAKHLKSLESEA